MTYTLVIPSDTARQWFSSFFLFAAASYSDRGIARQWDHITFAICALIIIAVAIITTIFDIKNCCSYFNLMEAHSNCHLVKY